MDAAWIGVIGAVAGAGVTAAVAVVAERRKANREDRHRWLEQRRDLYTRALAHAREWANWWAHYAWQELHQWDEDSRWYDKKDTHEYERRGLEASIDHLQRDLDIIGGGAVRAAVKDAMDSIKLAYLEVLIAQERPKVTLDHAQGDGLSQAQRAAESAIEALREAIRVDLVVR